MQELGLFHEAKLASQIEIINAPDENSPCYAIYAEMPEEPDEDEPEDSDVRVKYEEEKNAVLDRVQTCLDDQGEGDSIIETQESLFFNAAMVKHMDGNPSFQSHESLKDGVVPTELIAETYDDGGAKLIWDIFNSAVAALIIVSPDMFMEDDDHILNTLSANPEQTGSIATAGGKVLSNTKMLAVGGHSFEEGSGEAQELEMARRQYVQDEFNAKPFLARLFDVSDYRSAIVTLAHNSGWDTSDSSIGTQLKNVAKTFAALPSLITSSLNKMSYASAATSSSDFFGFGMVGYTEDQLNALPDYDVAADGIIKYHSEITTGNLKYSGIKEITSDGRITYQEDTNADNLDVSAAEAKPLGSDTAHGITLCDDFDVVAAGYVWADEDPDGSIAASCWSGEMIYAEKETTKDGEPVLDEDGDPVMEDTSVVIAGPTAYTTDQIVRTYLLDYPSIMAAAADDYRELCDDIEDAKDKSACETEKAEASDYIGEAMQDMGVMTGSESANTTNSEFNADTIQDDFQKTGCSSVGARQCTAVPHWFVDEYTSLTYGNGNGGQVSAFLATANNISTSSTPVAPAVFSGYTYNTSAICYPTSAPYGGKCGHTGLVIKVEGDVVTTLETWKGKAGQSPCSYIGTYKMSDHPDIQYVNLGEYLNEGA
jgi:hypothetical protein